MNDTNWSLPTVQPRLGSTPRSYSSSWKGRGDPPVTRQYCSSAPALEAEPTWGRTLSIRSSSGAIRESPQRSERLLAAVSDQPLRVAIAGRDSRGFWMPLSRMMSVAARTLTRELAAGSPAQP